MRPLSSVSVMLTTILSVSSLSITVTSSADAAQGDEEPSFLEEISGNVLSGIDAVADAVTKRTDDTVLPGVGPVLGSVVDGEESTPSAAPITG